MGVLQIHPFSSYFPLKNPDLQEMSLRHQGEQRWKTKAAKLKVPRV